MIEFGKTLREAREAKGLTTAQIADKTHMMVQVVEGLEHEDFSRIVAPIYGRGFVKLYCEAVGLDPKPYVDSFMEIYSSNRSPAPAPQPPPAPPPPEPESKEPSPPAEPAANEPPARPMELDFAGIRSATPPPAPAQVTPPPAIRTPNTPSRYSAPMPIDDRPSFSFPDFLSSVNWRLVVLVVATAALLTLVALGIRAIYRATMTVPDDAPTTQEPSAEKLETPSPKETTISAKPAESPVSKDVKISAKPNAKDTKPAAKPAATDAATRKPLPPRTFYIDSDHSSTQKEGK